MARKGKASEAQLILKLYDLRREAVMRQARSFVGGKFAPKSVEEFVAAIKKGGEEAGYLLQVYGYWDMVCAFVKHGFLSATLVYDTCQEMYFQYAKIQPYLSGFRKEMGLPEWMKNLQEVVEGSVKGRKRVADMRKNLERLREG
jgi:hypothetical protein